MIVDYNTGKVVKYNLEIYNENIEALFKRDINLIYKLLPLREEDKDWKKPLQTIIEELVGLNRLLFDFQTDLFLVICKLEGLFTLTSEEDFPLYRRTIFECLSLLNDIKNDCIR